jgi:lipopolysaccharide/colanic/teichoic acid biosynthesis glycosyltransferase
MGSPVFFRQLRPGYKGRPFLVVKFRTMRDARGPDGRQLSDTERLTRLGDLLRRTALDELPELWNVLRGEMSLVGPRPLLMEYLARYTPEEARRHDVRPGVTGWAQIHGRRSLDIPERLEMDVWYVDHWSLGLDLRIMVGTVRVLLGGAGSRTHDLPPGGDPWGSHADRPDPVAGPVDDGPS